MSLSKSVPISRSKRALFAEDEDQDTVYPPKNQKAWRLFEKAKSLLWFAEDVSLKSDPADWETLDKDTQHFIKHVLAFFATADSIVNDNLVTNIVSLIKQSDIKAFYMTQMYIETIHSEMYGLLLECYIKDKKECAELRAGSKRIPCIKRKADWAKRWIDRISSMPDPTEEDFAKLIIAFAVVEGIFFSSSFAAIFWLKKQYKGKCSGLTKSNEFIARDEGLHTEGACFVYKEFLPHIDFEIVKEIICDGVECEKGFVRDALNTDLVGMSATVMCEYVQFVADRLFAQLGYEYVYNTPNPFDFMENQALQTKSNFFEKNVSEYSMSGHDRKIAFDEDC